LPLLEMFVPLKARVQAPEGETWARGMRLAGRRVTEEEAEAMGQRLSAPQPVLDLLGKGSGLILLGDPGSGKTTFLKFLALRLALGGGAAVGPGGWLLVRVRVPAFANALALARKELPFGRFLPRHFAEGPRGRGISAWLAQQVTCGRLLFLLDGLDEVRDLDRRSQVVQGVQDFYGDARKRGHKFVLTSRVVGYREVRPAAEGLAEATLVDFEAEEIEAFIEKWTAALERAASGATQTAREEAEREREELLAAMRGNPGVRSLAAN